MLVDKRPRWTALLDITHLATDVQSDVALAVRDKLNDHLDSPFTILHIQREHHRVHRFDLDTVTTGASVELDDFVLVRADLVAVQLHHFDLLLSPQQLFTHVLASFANLQITHVLLNS